MQAMTLGDLLDELKKLFRPPAVDVALAPARVRSQPAQEWVARNRCW
jgi:hypothetical protein